MTRGSDLPSLARIRVLSELVINQIAAGEVIERPASVVKELVENALDAGAAHVQLDLEEGGVRLVRVVDDGRGMGREDLELAFAPHATSKLGDAADLEHIATLGFRGEALASIGSVARCKAFSRERGVELGHEIEIEGSRLSPTCVAGGAEGTRVEARDLFFNTPARRRFLKTTATELARALDVFQRLALAHPGVGFVATHDGRRLFDVEADMDLAGRVRRTFGAELAGALIPVEARSGTTALSGFVASPRVSRNDTARQMWFLNGRPVRDRILLRVLKEAFRGYLVEPRQPVAFLSLSIDPKLVDVNVHPAKAEVRFRDERSLFGFLVSALRAAVQRTDMATGGERLLAIAERREGWQATPPLRFGRAVELIDLPPARAPLSSAASEERLSPALERPRAVSAPAAVDPPEEVEAGDPGPCLQVDLTYILRATPEGFEILDQHALHERIQFEALRSALGRGRVECQKLLVPEILELDRASTELVESHRASFARLGVELERFGPTSIAVNGLPARMRRPDAEGLVREVLELVSRTGQAPDAAEVLEETLHRAACRMSVMAGDALTQEEMRELVRRGRGLSSDQTCPHARPTRVRFTRSDLERAFHRR